MLGEDLGCLFTERIWVRTLSDLASGAAWVLRMTIMSSS
jgi:hypothetical protein